MIKIYGIKNCDSVKKAISFFKKISLDYEFIDFKTTPINIDKIKKIIDKKGIDIVLNKKSSTYRNLGLSKLDLTNDKLLVYMSDNNLLIKRPLIEYNNEIIIGFDENLYKDTFTK
jgi:Spx/MgsR family transcriptional regulator